MLDDPDLVRAVQAVDEASWGPFPFLLAWRGGEAEVTLQFSGGVVVEVASVRVGDRFTNAHGWIGEADGNPWDELRDFEADMLESRLLNGSSM